MGKKTTPPGVLQKIQYLRVAWHVIETYTTIYSYAQKFLDIGTFFYYPSSVQLHSGFYVMHLGCELSADFQLLFNVFVALTVYKIHAFL